MRLTTSYKDLSQLLGSFWRTSFTSTGLVKSLLSAVGRGQDGVDSGVDVLQRSVSARDITPGAVAPWLELPLDSSTEAVIQYGASYTYGGSVVYGQVERSSYAYALPQGVLSVGFLYDDRSNPSIVMTEGFDYVVASGYIVFKKPLPSGVTSLWGHRVLMEADFVASQLGYVLGLFPSDATCTGGGFWPLWRLYSFGPNKADFMELIGTCLGTPVFRHDDETVVSIETYPETKYVVTDKDVYSVVDAEIVVVPGGKYSRGDSMTDALEIVHDKWNTLPTDVPNPGGTKSAYMVGGRLCAATSMTLIRVTPSKENTALLATLRDLIPPETGILLILDRVAETTETTGVVGELAEAATAVQCVSLDIPEDSVYTRAYVKSSYSYGI